MLQFLIVFGIFAIAIVGFGASLHFSKYKKRASGCCGGGHSCYNEKINYIDKNVLSKN